MFNNLKRTINQSYLMISNLVEEELKSNFKLVDLLSSPVQTSIKSTIAVVEAIRISYFIHGITNGEMTEEEFISHYKEYGAKKLLIELIEKQRRTHTEIINLLCGCIIKSNYRENTMITPTQINQINFLISLTANDFYNCLIMYDECKNNRIFYSDANPKALEAVLTTKSRLEQYGYAKTNIFCGGDIALNVDFFDFMEQSILNNFTYEELKEAVIA